MDTCQCGKDKEAIFIAVKESGEEVKICADCASWWKKVDPTIILWTV